MTEAEHLLDLIDRIHGDDTAAKFGFLSRRIKELSNKPDREAISMCLDFIDTAYLLTDRQASQD